MTFRSFQPSSPETLELLPWSRLCGRNHPSPEQIDRFQDARWLLPCWFDLDPSVAVGGIEGKPTLVAVRMEAVDPTEGVCHTAVGQHTTGELHGPHDGFIDFGKFDRVGLGFLSRDFDGFLAGQVTARLQGVNADIHQRSSTGQSGLESPLVPGSPILKPKPASITFRFPKVLSRASCMQAW